MKAFAALIRLQWMETRAYVAYAVGIIVSIFPFMFAIAALSGDEMNDGSAVVVGAVLAQALIAIATSLSHCGRDGISPRLPQRVFILPVSTRMLVTAYLGYRVALVTAFALYGAIVLWIHDRGDLGNAAGYLLLALIFPVAQALLWLIKPHHWYWLAPAVFVALLTAQSILPSMDEGTVGITLCVLGVLLPVPIAALGLSIDRHRPGHAIDFPVGSMMWPRSRRETFASAAQAQRWFEMRTRGVVLPICFAGAAIIFSGLALVAGAPPSELFVFMPWYSLFAAVFFSGVILPVYDNELRRNGTTSFAWTHPIGTRVLERESLRAIAYNLVVCFGLVLFVSVIAQAAMLADDVPIAQRILSSEPSLIPATVGLSIAALIVITLLMWSLLTLFYGWMAFLGVVAVILSSMNLFDFAMMEVTEGTPSAIGAASFNLAFGSFALLVALAGWRCAQLRLLGKHDYLVMAVLAGAGLIAAMIIHTLPLPDPLPLMVTPTVTLFAIAPFCVMPLIHHWARHR